MKMKNESGEAFNALFSELSEADVKKLDLRHKIASEILSLRKQKDFGQKELADYMEVSQGLVAKWESGKCNFTIDTLVDIFDKFDLNVDLSFSEKAEEECYACDPIEPEAFYEKYSTGFAFSNNLLPYAG